MPTSGTDQSGTRGLVLASALSCLFAMLLGSGGGFGTAIGLGAVGLVMPVLSTALLTVVLVTGEPWEVVGQHFLSRAALAVLGIATIAGSTALLWRFRRGGA